MSTSLSSRLARCGLAGLGVVVLLAAHRDPGARFGGTYTMTYTQRVPTPVADADGHVLLATTAQGIHHSTGSSSYMDGATVVNSELADLVQGNGTHQGYLTMSLNGEVVTIQWTGKVNTTQDADHHPVTSFSGTWVQVRGPGGHGTYAGRITGPDTYSVEWQGEIAQRN